MMDINILCVLCWILHNWYYKINLPTRSDILQGQALFRGVKPLRRTKRKKTRKEKKRKKDKREEDRRKKVKKNNDKKKKTRDGQLNS